MPYLAKEHIEQAATGLLGEYGERFGVIAAPPVPIDEIVELYLGLTIDFVDFRSLFPGGDVDGALWVAERIVGVDRSLDPTLSPACTGRYQFTLAHEVGHWTLHRRWYVTDPPRGGRNTPQLCRATLRRDRLEWQADYFAACLLMPRTLIVDAWVAWQGTAEATSAYQFCSLPASLRAAVLARRGCVESTGPKAENALLERACRPLARRFAVSEPAMRIRLEGLGLVVRDRPEQFRSG